jgi:hypothetical protein
MGALIMLLLVTPVMVFLPYFMSDAILAMQPGGFSLAVAGPHWAMASQSGFLSTIWGEFLALLVATFFFMACWSQDDARWRYYFIALIVFDLFNWFTVYAVGLTVVYFYFGLGSFIVNEAHVWASREIQKPIPVTPVEMDPKLVKEIEWRKKWMETYKDGMDSIQKQNMQAKLYPNTIIKPEEKKRRGSDSQGQTCGVPISPYGTINGKASSIPSTLDYTSAYPPETVRYEKKNKPVKGIRWFAKHPVTGRAMSTGYGTSVPVGKGQWDDIGQITASQTPTPDNTAGAYMFDYDMIDSPEFNKYAEPGGFVAEVDMWGQIIFHGNEHVYRGEHAKIQKALFTYEEWEGGLRTHFWNKKGKRK